MSRREARQQAKRLPWERLEFALEQYLGWRAFLLWFRAIADAESGVRSIAPDFVLPRRR
jgi:hypothetical protein